VKTGLSQTTKFHPISNINSGAIFPENKSLELNFRTLPFLPLFLPENFPKPK
jgi:hypothetical protein